MPLSAPSAGTTYGEWTGVHVLGRGGHGEVWLSRNAAGSKAAIKVLRKVKQTAYSRFKDEVAVMSKNSDVPGLLPILGFNLPADLGEERAWYAMPVALPLAQHLKGQGLAVKADAIASVAETLATLHSRGIVHRDIKPSNLFAFDGRPYVGDFGLVDYPSKADLTGDREQLGPRWTMAPEIRRMGRDVDAKPGDVYSLAKALWILVTAREQGFDGQYSPVLELAIKPFVEEVYLSPLDRLISDATAHDPSRRPSMSDLAVGIRKWIQVAADFHARNPQEWAELQRRLFPLVSPSRAHWEDLDSILQVLTILGEIPNLNHLFFPSGGGLDLECVRRAPLEPGCIEMRTNGLTTIVRPQRLLFESFPFASEWNYFRLETGELKPSGVSEIGDDWLYEEVTEVAGCGYADRTCWDDDEYQGESLPPGSRCVSRYFRGAFVIFQKTSTYNRNLRTYDARHNKMTAEEFRAYIATAAAGAIRSC